LVDLLFAIDPGIRGTGVAFFHKGNLVSTRNITPPIADDWRDATLTVVNKIHEYIEVQLKSVNSKLLFSIMCEWPHYMEHAAGIAANTQGDILKLAYFIGALEHSMDQWGTVDNKNAVSFDLVEVRTWKGQLAKAEVINRIKARLPAETLTQVKPTSHSWDAIGIGMYTLGIKLSG
jgi:hypothetical protein